MKKYKLCIHLYIFIADTSIPEKKHNKVIHLLFILKKLDTNINFEVIL